MDNIFSGRDSVKACAAKWESKLGDVQVSRGLLTESLSGGESSDQTSPNQYINTSQYSNIHSSSMNSQYSNSFISDGSRSPVNSPFTAQVAAIERARMTGFMKDAANLLRMPEVVLKVQQDLTKNVITYEFTKTEAVRKKTKRPRSKSPAVRKSDDDPPKDPKAAFAPVVQQLNFIQGRKPEAKDEEEERPRKRGCFSFRGISTTVIIGYLCSYLCNAFMSRMTGQALDLFQMQMAGAFFGSFVGGEQAEEAPVQLQELNQGEDSIFRFLNETIKVDNAGLEQLFGDYTF